GQVDHRALARAGVSACAACRAADVMAGLVTAGRVYPTAALNRAELGQARVPVPSTSSPEAQKTWMPAPSAGMTEAESFDLIGTRSSVWLWTCSGSRRRERAS